MNFPCKPFTVPNFVLLDKVEKKPKRNTVVALPAMPLSEVDPKELSQMCDAFRAEVFKRSGHTDPRTTLDR